MIRRSIFAVVVSLFAVGVAEPGGQQQVNTLTGGDQSLPSVAVMGDGRLVVVWQSPEQGGVAGLGIIGRLLRSDGTPIEAPFAVNSFVGGDQKGPDVFADGQGGFVVVWDGAGPGDTAGIFARRFDSSATPLGPEFLVNSSNHPLFFQNSARIAGSPSGDFVVAWRGAFGTSYQTISAQRFDSSGTAVGAELTPSNVSGYHSIREPAMDCDSNGDFVIAWEHDYVYYHYYEDVQMVEYNSAGSQISSGTHHFDYANERLNPSVGKRDSHFVLAWQRYDYTDAQGQGYRIKTQLYENSLPIGGTTTASTDFGAKYPDVATASDGFVVVWSHPQDYEIRGRRFDGGSIPTSPEVIVTDQIFGPVNHPRIAELDTGDVAAVWEAPDGDGVGVFVAVIPFLEPVFGDGFENGTTGNWDVSSPN